MELTPMLPLQKSVDYQDDDEDSIEHELKLLFIALFEHYLRTKFRRIDHFGYPHLLDTPDFEAVQRFIKLDGLSLLNRETNNQPYMLEVFRAWRGQHSRRGLGFLEFYLQMLWPNAWTIKQQYHPIATQNNYPLDILDDEVANSFLTSRVAVTIDPNQLTSPSEVTKMLPSLKRVVPARIVLNVSLGVDVVVPFNLEVGMAFIPTVCMTFEDSAVV